MKALLIVDPQIDFISGTLPVAGADKAMDRLAETLPAIAVDEIIVTMDCHPIRHCSFKENGGIWPPHCVKYSVGAAIWPPLMQALIEARQPVTFIEKGTAVERDQYSAFDEAYPALLDDAEEIYLCGIAGNVCVLNTLKDLARHGLGDKITVITDAAPSLDDGTALREMIEETDVKITTLNQL
ncbi:MAG: isochorismatase family protein [Porphyromonas sp.]|nr:isochorismatase family protein [Porphyromonas sp.]